MTPRALFAIFTALVLLAGGAAAGAEPEQATLMEQVEEAYRARDAERTAALAKRLLEASPGRGDAWFALSRAHEWADRLDEAIAAGERAQEIGWYGGASATYRVARLHARAGHAEAALEWLERALAERFEDRPAIAGEEAFAALRDDERFRRLAGIPPAGELSRVERWRFDLDYLVEEARRMHADPERPAFGEEFGAAAASLREAIPGLGDQAILLRLMRLLAILDDGHTAIYGPDEDSPYAFDRRRLPLKLYWFPEGLYVTDGVGEWAALAGRKIVRFGELDAGEVLRRMSEYRGVDNPMTWRWLGPGFYAGSLGLLEAVGASSGGEAVELTLEAPDGSTSKVAVQGGEHEIPRKLRPSPAMSGEVPLWLSRVDTSFWLTPLAGGKVVYFQFNQVRDREEETIAEFADRLRGALAAPGVDTLIVDVRHNNGGNNSLVRPLVRALVEFEMRAPGRRIFVIAGRNTFSAAQNFITRVEQWTDATFTGEPSSSSPNFTGEETNLLLPTSRIRGSISTRYWQDSGPFDRRPWIPPDIPVELTAADYFAGRDPVLEAVLAAAGKGRR